MFLFLEVVLLIIIIIIGENLSSMYMPTVLALTFKSSFWTQKSKQNYCICREKNCQKTPTVSDVDKMFPVECV